jgi:GINS complex subunit 1
MYGDLALQLVTASHRTTQSTTPLLPLPKYALPLILSIALETRQLGQSIAFTASSHSQLSLSQDKSLVTNLTIQHLSARRNKRCLLAYLHTRTLGIKERWWESGGALSHLLEMEDGELRNNLSPQEMDFLKGYNGLMLDYKSEFLDVLDITAGVEKPPGELMVDVRVRRDAGEVVLESGERVELRKGERFRLIRSQVERLIVQGYLEEV